MESMVDRLSERVARRIALPERGPDEAFVLRTDLSLRAEALRQSETKVRREQALTEIAAVGGLALAAQQMLKIGEGSEALLMPLIAGGGAMATAWAVGSLLLAVVTRETGRSSAEQPVAR